MLVDIEPVYVTSLDGSHEKTGKGIPPKEIKTLPPTITHKESHQAQTLFLRPSDGPGEALRGEARVTPRSRVKVSSPAYILP